MGTRNPNTKNQHPYTWNPDQGLTQVMKTRNPKLQWQRASRNPEGDYKNQAEHINKYHSVIFNFIQLEFEVPCRRNYGYALSLFLPKWPLPILPPAVGETCHLLKSSGTVVEKQIFPRWEKAKRQPGNVKFQRRSVERVHLPNPKDWVTFCTKYSKFVRGTLSLQASQMKTPTKKKFIIVIHT